MHPSLRESADFPLVGVKSWTAHLDGLTAAELKELTAQLDSAEHARAAKFRFDADRKHYAATRALLRSLIGDALRISPSGVTFEYGAQGKPALARECGGESNLQFNVSHSGGWAMFALASNRQVGIDLESAARLDHDDNELARLAVRVLSARELAIWQTLSSTARRRAAFLRAWVRKEACAKAMGRGIFTALENIEVALDATAPQPSLTIAATNRSGLTSDCVLHDLAAPEGFAAALAVAAH